MKDEENLVESKFCATERKENLFALIQFLNNPKINSIISSNKEFENFSLQETHQK